MFQRFSGFELNFLQGLRPRAPDLQSPICFSILPVPKLSPGYALGHPTVLTKQVINNSQSTINTQSKHAE